MSDEQIEEAIALIKAMLAARADETAQVIEGEAEVVPMRPNPAFHRALAICPPQ